MSTARERLRMRADAVRRNIESNGEIGAFTLLARLQALEDAIEEIDADLVEEKRLELLEHEPHHIEPLKES